MNHDDKDPVPISERNPYFPEIVGTFLFAPLVLGLETWRRWGDWLNPAALDDWIIFGAAILVAGKLVNRNDRLAPVLWVFVCGGAWFLFVLSLWGSIYSFKEGDPSGFPVSVVIIFKACGLALISAASWRAIHRLTPREQHE